MMPRDAAIAHAIDTVYTAETPEGIALTLRPAGVMARSLAYLIDLAIRAALYLIFAIVLGVLGKLGLGVFAIFVFALEWLYPVLFELSLGGATPGKRALGVRVVMDSGLPVTVAASVTRNLLRTADWLPACYGLGLAWMLWNADSKRLGDLAAGTLVVYAEQVRLDGKIPAAAPLAPAQPLTLREQAAIVGWAGRAARLTPERFEELAALAAPVLGPPDGLDTRASPRLLGVAQWALGRRGSEQAGAVRDGTMQQVGRAA
jgi:uncharacterized RDD family membrane protein YckC